MRSVTSGAVLFAFWCVVVPPHGLGDAVVGAAVAATLSLWAGRQLWPLAQPVMALHHPWRLPGFALRMVARVLRAALQVASIVIDPRLPIAPEVIVQRQPFSSEAARSAYANAITVTPGTLTLDVDGDAITIHCLDRALAREVIDGRLARDVERLFGREAA